MASTRNALIVSGCAILVLLAVCTGALVAGGWFILDMALDSEFANAAIERAASDPEVIEALGEPIEPNMFGATFNLSFNNDHERGELSVKLEGSHDTGRLRAHGEREGEAPWSWHELTVNVDGREIDVLAD